MNIEWSQQSLEDLRAIHAYIARDSDLYAGLVVQRIATRVEEMIRMPTAGHPVHEHPQSGLREVHQDRYRIIYCFDDQCVKIITIVHMKQLLPARRLKRRP